MQAFLTRGRQRGIHAMNTVQHGFNRSVYSHWSGGGQTDAKRAQKVNDAIADFVVTEKMAHEIRLLNQIKKETKNLTKDEKKDYLNQVVQLYDGHFIAATLAHPCGFSTPKTQPMIIEQCLHGQDTCNLPYDSVRNTPITLKELHKKQDQLHEYHQQQKTIAFGKICDALGNTDVTPTQKTLGRHSPPNGVWRIDLDGCESHSKPANEQLNAPWGLENNPQIRMDGVDLLKGTWPISLDKIMSASVFMVANAKTNRLDDYKTALDQLGFNGMFFPLFERVSELARLVGSFKNGQNQELQALFLSGSDSTLWSSHIATFLMRIAVVENVPKSMKYIMFGCGNSTLRSGFEGTSFWPNSSEHMNYGTTVQQDAFNVPLYGLAVALLNQKKLAPTSKEVDAILILGATMGILFEPQWLKTLDALSIKKPQPKGDESLYAFRPASRGSQTTHSMIDESMRAIGFWQTALTQRELYDEHTELEWGIWLAVQQLILKEPQVSKQILRSHHPEFLRTFEELSASDFQTAIQKVQPLIQKIRKEKDKEIQRYGKVAQLRVKNGSMGGLMPV